MSAVLGTKTHRFFPHGSLHSRPHGVRNENKSTNEGMYVRADRLRPSARDPARQVTKVRYRRP